MTQVAQYPLSQAQKLWLTQHGNDLQTQTLVLQLANSDTLEQWQNAWQQLCDAHSILSMQFSRIAGVTLPIMQASEVSVNVEPVRCENTVLHTAAASLPALSLSLPLTVHFVTHDAGQSLIIRALPCLLDAMSIQLVACALQQLAAGEECEAINEESITQFPDFCAWLQDLQADEDAVEAQQFWRAQHIDSGTGQLFEQQTGSASPVCQQVTRTIDAEQVSALHDWALSHSAFDPEDAETGATEQILVFLVRLQQQRLSVGQPVLYWLHDCRLDYDELTTCFGPMARPLAITHSIELSQSNADSWQAWQQHAMEILEAQENLPETELHAAMAVQFLPEFALNSHHEILQWAHAVLNQPLTLQIQQEQGALQLTWHYDSTIFNGAAMQQMADGLLTLATQFLAATPAQHPAELALIAQSIPRPIFTPSRVPKTLTTEQPPEASELPHLLSQIQHHAQQHAESIALQAGDTQLSYGQLWQQIANVSAAIAQYPITAEQPVAIYVERGLSAVVAMLATWAADSFYVMLDTDWPANRINTVLEQAAPALIIHDSLFDTENNALNTSPALPMVDIHTAIATNASELADIEAIANHESLAYLLFTSGSTGRPKGVQVTQRNLAHYSKAVTAQLGLTRYQQFLHCATFSADMGHTVLFPALAQGKTVHIPPMQTLTNGGALASYIATHHVDVIKYVPSHLQALLSSTESASVLPQQCLILGGEPCSAQLLSSIQTSAPSLAIFNHYGPTETTVGIAIHAVQSPAQSTSTATHTTKGMPLTQSLGDNQIFLLTPSGHNAAFGELGEVVVQGSSVSAGYKGDAASNVSTAFITLNGQRAYRTGDLARLNSRGELHLAGRADHQVKIRGYRVELGDIEACLASAENVTHAAVKAQPQGDTQWLVAYVSGNNVEETQLNAWLAERLPEMMLPQRIVVLDALPLLASGKIDRQSLPSIDALASQDLGHCEPPANDVEFIVHHVFKQVLGLEEIGVTWDFFAIGGHSLSAIKITGQLRKQLQMDLPPGLLFEHSTIRKLAIAAQSRESAPGKLAAVAKIRRQLAAMTPEQLAALKAKQATS